MNLEEAKGLTPQKLRVIIQALRARAFEEIEAAFKKNSGENIFAEIDSLNLLEQGIARELNQYDREEQEIKPR